VYKVHLLKNSLPCAKELTMTSTNLDISVDCVVFGFDGQEVKVLVIEQRPQVGVSKTQLALPGDLVRVDENLDDAAQRILKELTNLNGLYLHQFKAFGDINRVSDFKDQEWLRAFRTNPEARVVTVAYYSLIPLEKYKPQASSFAGHVEWRSIDSIPDLAFDHNKIIHEGLNALKRDLDAVDLVFELLPEKFTLTQLQTVYEQILDKELDKRNFRKKIKSLGRLKALDEKEKDVDHKPAQLYSTKS